MLTAASRVLACVSLLLVGCGPKNIQGRTVLVEEKPYTARGESLSYYAGIGSDEEVKEPPVQPASFKKAPVVVFVADENEECEAFADEAFRAFVTRFAGNAVLVRPKGKGDVTCGTPEHLAYDVKARLAELDGLVAALEKDHPGQPLVVVGEAFGASIALDWIGQNPAAAAGFVSLGGPPVDAERVRVQLVRESGAAQEQVIAEADEVRSTFRRIATKPDATAPLWGRGEAFWSQLAGLDPKAVLSSYAGPALMLHGDGDRSRVPSSLVGAARRELKRAGRSNISWKTLEGLGADLRHPTAFLEIDDFVADHVAKGVKKPAAE